MSVIASFHLLPTNKLIGLREVWPENYEFLKKHGKEYFDYSWSGRCFYPLIEFLKSEKDVDLSESDYNLLFPGAAEGGTWFFDAQMKKKYRSLLDPKNISKKDVRKCFEDYFGDFELESSDPVLEALDLINQSFELVNEQTLMLMHLG